MLTTELRNANLADTLKVLEDQRQARFDVVVPAGQLRYTDGNLVLAGMGDEVLVGDTVDEMRFEASDLVLNPTEDCDTSVFKRLGIPLAYGRRMRDEALGLLDQNVNHWLSTHGKNVLVRAWRDGNGGTARTILSDAYGIFENLDFLAAVLEGIQATGQPVEIEGLNLSDRNLRLDITSPAVEAMAPAMLAGYVSPFSGQRGEDLPIIRAGIRFTNSEIGFGRLKLVPFVKVLVCSNGATMEKMAEDFSLSRVHRGARLTEGAITWSQETRSAQLASLAAQAKDAVRHFLDPEWFQGTIANIEAKATKPLEAGQAINVIADVSKTLGFTNEERDGIFTAFLEGRQLTNGGVFQAITAHAQRVPNVDRAALLQEKAFEALDLV